MLKKDGFSADESMPGEPNIDGPYKVYAAGGMFTQHELTTNVLIKESVWRASNGKFELVLPQSKELRDLDRSDIAVIIRNGDLLQVVKADIFLARFDGLELDAGTVIEFMLAKNLGKPTVILRSDSRRLSSNNLDDPYNLMVKNWPRTVEIHIDSLMNYIASFADEQRVLSDGGKVETTIKAEFNVVQKGVDEISRKIIAGFESVLAMNSPYPLEYQVTVYKILRYSPGGGFEQLLTEEDLDKIIQRLRNNGTL